MRKTLGILLSTAAIGLGGIIAATPATADPLIIENPAVIIGPPGAGTYWYEPPASERWEGQTQVYPPTVYAYPYGVYETAPYAYPYAYGPGYGERCYPQSERVPSGAGNTEWRNYTICD